MSRTPFFTFGLITDTHIRPPQGDDSSPYSVNDLANDRARHACRLITTCQPAFTIHLGDMVHTLPHLPTYQDACAEAHKIFESLKPNLQFVAGNHDVGDKPMLASPAGAADGESEKKYREMFGKGRYVFSHGDCAFVVVNSSLFNSETDLEIEQRQWLAGTLGGLAGKRIFL